MVNILNLTLEDHPLSTVCDSLFNTLAANLHPLPKDALWLGDKGIT